MCQCTNGFLWLPLVEKSSCDQEEVMPTPKSPKEGGEAGAFCARGRPGGVEGRTNGSLWRPGQPITGGGVQDGTDWGDNEDKLWSDTGF